VSLHCIKGVHQSEQRQLPRATEGSQREQLSYL
jgi:hypothetical protein